MSEVWKEVQDIGDAFALALLIGEVLSTEEGETRVLDVKCVRGGYFVKCEPLPEEGKDGV